MQRFIVLSSVLLILAACGGPSETDIQATVGVAVQGTAQAGEVATSVQATQTAAACEAPTLNAYADMVEPQIKAFEQQAQLVGTTPRVSLGVPLQRLLDIQTETRKIARPSCLEDMHTRILDMMQQYQEAYQNFAAQGDDVKTNDLITQAGQKIADLKHALPVLRTGTVPPAPTPSATPRP